MDRIKIYKKTVALMQHYRCIKATPNMFAAMGFAGSENVKAMIQNGLVVTAVQVGF
ncbi:H gluconate symporter, partial [Legionella shakespearei DSM 23087]